MYIKNQYSRKQSFRKHKEMVSSKAGGFFCLFSTSGNGTGAHYSYQALSIKEETPVFILDNVRKAGF